MPSHEFMNSCRTLEAGARKYRYYALDALGEDAANRLPTLPVSLKILLENLVRNLGGGAVKPAQVRALLDWTLKRDTGDEIPFHPVRVMMPDSSGIPLLADLAAMRDAIARFDGDPRRVNPRIPLDLVVDHSVSVEVAGTADAAQRNLALEFERNGERYTFLRWAQQAFDGLRVVPPGNGICHQINLERLAQVVWTLPGDAEPVVCPDALVAMDSHTPMVNSLGVLAWGVGGIEAATAMLGQPIGIRIPRVVGCRLVGSLQAGVTTTDLVLTVTQRLRAHGVVGDFVEFCGPGMRSLTLPERATLSNMCPEYGSTTALFPIDAQTLRYLTLTARDADHVRLVEAYAKAQGLWHDETIPEPLFSDLVEIDLAAVEPSAAGPRRPHDRIALGDVRQNFAEVVKTRTGATPAPPANIAGRRLEHGDVVVAAITSCTNTSNPMVMVAAGILARNAAARGLKSKPWVKTSLAPGSRVVAGYLRAAGLQDALDQLGFQVVGFGCTTCMGNSGPLAADIAQQVKDANLIVTAVLSGNRNFESRIHPLAKTNYLVSPPLVVAYALAGSVQVDLTSDALGLDRAGEPVFLRDIWPKQEEIAAIVAQFVGPGAYRECYAEGFSGSERWEALAAAGDDRYAWDPHSLFIKPPPFFDGFERLPPAARDIRGARALAILGDSVNTDHISPIGVIPADGPAGKYLIAEGVAPAAFGTYMERRVNHHVMVRGTFANLQLRNELVPGREGGLTRHFPGGEEMSIYDAAMRYASEQTPLVIVAGAEYGAGSSRDWAAKGTRLLGIRAVLAESFERIHRSNLIGMGVLPLQFPDGVSRSTLRLSGNETFDLVGLEDLHPLGKVVCRINRDGGGQETLQLQLRLDTERELAWYRHGGVLSQALRALM